MRLNKKNFVAGFLMIILFLTFNLSVFATVSNSTKSKMKQSYLGSVNYIKNRAKTNGLSDWDAVALAMAGYNINSSNLKFKGKTYIESKQNDILKELSYNWTTSYAKHILTITSSGYDPSNFNGINLIEILKNSQLENGKFKDTIDSTTERYLNSHIWSIIALETIKENYNKGKAVQFLESNQNKDGGFSWLIGNKNSDIDTTAMAITALTMAGRTKSSASVSKALNFLRIRIKNLPKESQTAETLSWVIQAVVSAKDDLSKYYVGKRNILEELYLYRDKTGGFKHVKSGKVDAIATNQVLRALITFNSNKNMYLNIRFIKGNFYKAVSKSEESNVVLYSSYFKDLKNAELIVKASESDEAILLVNGDKNVYNLKSIDGYFKFNKNLELKSLSYKLLIRNNNKIVKTILGAFEPVEKTYTVNVRIETPDKTIGIFEVKTGNKTVYDFNGKPYNTSVPSAYASVAKALIDNNLSFEMSYYDFGPMLNSIGEYNTIFESGKWWGIWANNKSLQVGMSDYELHQNEEILLYYINDGKYDIKPLEIVIPEKVNTGDTVEVKVVSDSDAVAGATVYVGSSTYTTNEQGIAQVKFDNVGKFEIYAEKNKDGKPEYVRSKKVFVEVK